MKRSNIIAMVLIGLGLIGIIGLLVYQNSNDTPKYTETTIKEPELGSGKSVAFKNTSGLSDVLLPKQVLTLNTMLDEFLLDYLDPNTTSGSITTGPDVNQDGSVTFTMEVTTPEGKRYSFERKDPNSDYASSSTITGTSKATTVFTVTVFRDSYTSLTIKIREYNYTNVRPLSN